MEVNRNGVSNGVNITSIDSSSGDHNVGKTEGKVGHLSNGVTVSQTSANPKPSTFFGWLKRLFGFGGNSEKTAPSKVTKVVNQDLVGDMDDAAARVAAIDDNIEIIEDLAQKYPKNEKLRSILKGARDQSTIANDLNEKDSLNDDDLVSIKNAFDQVRGYMEQADKIDISEKRNERAEDQLKKLDTSEKIKAQRILMQPGKKNDLFDKSVELRDQPNLFTDEKEFLAKYNELDQVVQSAKQQFGELSDQAKEAREERLKYINEHPQFEHLFAPSKNQTGVQEVANAIDKNGYGSSQAQELNNSRQKHPAPWRRGV